MLRRFARQRRLARASNERALLVLEVPDVLPACAVFHTLARLGRGGFTTVIANRRRDAADRVRHWLGRDSEDLLWLAPAPVRPSEVAAVLGSLRAGRAALLVVETAAWRRSRLLRDLSARCRVHDPLLQHLVMSRRWPRATLPGPSWAGRGARAPAVAGRSDQAPPGHDAIRAELLAVREAQYGRLLVSLERDPQACVLLTGPRGSGKSTLLARLARNLASTLAGDAKPRVLIVTATVAAPMIAAIDAEKAGVPTIALPAALDANGLTLLIDEAASLPIATLERLVARHARIVMASTVEGYEANGRAFANRLPDRLDAQRPGWLDIRLAGSLRFANDRLNRLLRERLLLSAFDGPADPASADSMMPPRDASDASLQIERCDAAMLRRERASLRQVASLLARCHYRTGLDDIDALLDGRLDVWRARERSGALLGVATVAVEGGIPAELAGPILAGRRRLPDQLLPQLLARAADSGEALSSRYQRITRIAVAPHARRSGVASALVRAVREAAGVDTALGASFACGPVAEPFWASLGFAPVYRASRVNPRSGERSVTVIDGGDAITRELVARLSRAPVHRSIMSDSAHFPPPRSHGDP